MGNDTKWADVAHYYLRSGIKCNVSRGDLTGKQGDWRQSVEKFGAKHLRVNSDGMTFWCVPILRHRDDMTEAEAREIYRLAWGFDIDISVSAWDSGIEWVESLDGSYPSYIFHWFISRGFDVFGLIESGQAIRKEVTNVE